MMDNFDFGKPSEPRASKKRRKRSLPSLAGVVVVSVVLLFLLGPCAGGICLVVLGFVWWNWA